MQFAQEEERLPFARKGRIYRAHGTEELLIDYEGPGIIVAFNGRYLADVLGVLDTAERLILELTDATKPGVVRAEGDEGYCSVIMPMRVD